MVTTNKKAHKTKRKKTEETILITHKVEKQIRRKRLQKKIKMEGHRSEVRRQYMTNER
jgi:hypothetical protein